MKLPRAGNLLFAVVATTVILLLLEGVASVLMSVRSGKHALRMMEESHTTYDADLGWANRANLRLPDLYGRGRSFTTNARGLRALEDYDRAVPAGRYRIVCLGDSFTMGFGVADGESYPAQMQGQCPAIQAVNMGQGGYGVDQDYLWYKRDGVKLEANLLLFAVIAHDFFRMADDDFIGYAKPALRVRDGTLKVENVPVPRTWGVRTPLRRMSAFLESLGLVRLARWAVGRVAPAPERFYGAADDRVLEAAALALEDLARQSRERGQGFVLAYLPSRDLLASEPTREAVWLEGYARRQGIPFINLVPEFGRRTPWEIEPLFRPDHHYSVEGNRFVAGELLRRLGEVMPGFPACPSR